MPAIGRLPMTHPRPIILDEATEALVPQIAQRIWQVLAGPRGEGIATLIVDRDRRRAAAHADRLLRPAKGCVALEGDAASLAGTPALLDLPGV